MHPQNFMIFGTYKVHNAENEMMLSYVIISTLIRQRALQTWVLSICIIAVLLSLNFYIETVHSFRIHY